MLRNSTQQFRDKYQNTHPHPYCNTGILELRACKNNQLQPKHRYTSPPSSPQSCRNHSRKLEQSVFGNMKTLQARTKQGVDDRWLGKQIKVGKQNRRQLTAPLAAKEGDQQSETSIESFKLQQECLDSIAQRDPVEFINSLPKNSVFFCCRCFQYVFQIEKKRHFPDCKETLDITNKDSSHFRQIAWERLERIAELCRFAGVKVWEVEELYRQIRNNEFNQIYRVGYPTNCRFFSLDEIVTAFVYTYETLLKGAIYPSPIFGCF